MGIKAVAFDFGNVISLPQDTDDLNRLAEIVGVDRTTMNELAMKDRADYDRGALSGKEYYARGLSKLGKVFDEEALAALVKADLESWANVNPATVALMDEVKAAGAKIAILSNMPHEFLALSRVRFPFFSNLFLRNRREQAGPGHLRSPPHGPGLESGRSRVLRRHRGERLGRPGARHGSLRLDGRSLGPRQARRLRRAELRGFGCSRRSSSSSFSG